MFKAAVGHSEDVLTEGAIQEAIDQIREALDGAEPQAGILFCSVDYNHAVLLANIRAAFPSIELVGCTTDGELSSSLGFAEDSLILIVFASNTVQIRAGVGREAAHRGEEAGKEAAASARAGLNHVEERFAILLPDPLYAGSFDVDQGIRSVFGSTFPVLGGAASAHSKQRKTYQFYNNEVLTDSVVLLLFAGPVVFSYGIRGGFSKVGTQEPVTAARDNVVYRIGDKPALEYFRKYIGSVDLFINYCLAVYDKDEFYLRSAPSADTEEGSVTLNSRIPEGAMVQIVAMDKETVVQSCYDSVSQAVESYSGEKPAAALVFSCAGRKLTMGTQVVKEVQAVRQYLPDVPFAGFYCYGEFGPSEKDGPYGFHGTTFVTLLLGQAGEE